MDAHPALHTVNPGNTTEGDETLLVTLGFCPSVHAGLFAHGITPWRTGTDRSSGGSGLRGLAIAVNQLARTITQLRTHADPVIHTIQIDPQALLALDRNRIVETEALDVTAASRATRISGNEVVERTLFRTRS
jgi:hypothetical protein